MEWQIITCDNSRHIVEAQKYLFRKYVSNAELRYIDLKSEDVKRWSWNVLDKLDTSNELTIFGLDDFLPIDYFPDFELPEIDFKRLELGWGGRKGIKLGDHWTLFKRNELYRVSCQFSIWGTKELENQLKDKKDPWKFEVKGKIEGNVLGLQKPFRYIEESAISARQKGKINLCGLRQEDITELIDLKLVDPDKIIYGWKGTNERTKESYGKKYAKYY